MPIYEYKCTHCANKFERLVKMNADAPPCPQCDQPVKKLVSQGSFQLKGSGWFKDGYGLRKGKKRGR